MKATPSQLAGLLAASVLVPDDIFAKMAGPLELPADKKTAALAIMARLGLVPGGPPAPPETPAGPVRSFRCTIGEGVLDVSATSSQEAAEKAGASHVLAILGEGGRAPRHITVAVGGGDGAAVPIKVAVKIAVTTEAHG